MLSMTLQFYKYHGAGNDFLLLDRRTMSRSLTHEEINFLCDRRFGIGADGIIIVGDHHQVDFLMEFFNADGSSGAMCSNGSRCAIDFAKVTGYIEATCQFVCCDIFYSGTWHASGDVSTSFPDLYDGRNVEDGYLLDTGAPHFVRFCERLDDFDPRTIGRRLRYSDLFAPQGANINFVRIDAPERGDIVTYERGVEDLTLACGTGALAAAMAYAQLHELQGTRTMNLTSAGGTLNIEFHREGSRFSNIHVRGPVAFVFKTQMTL